MATYEKIDYRLRPAKNIERKMMIDVIRRLSSIIQLEEYKYIGLPSLYYSDARLFHTRLGIEDIVCIEREEEDEKRFIFNKPYDFIDLKIGHSSEILPELSWEKPVILWLDYDDKISSYMFADIRQFISEADPGSIVFLTVNAHPDHPNELDRRDETMVDVLQKRISNSKIPPDVEQKDLRGWGYGDVVRRILINEIEETLIPNRNAVEPDDKQVEFKQLVNFKYQDGAKMRTIGGILHSDQIKNEFDSAAFNNLEFYRDGDESCHIQVPKMTFREMRSLDQYMPEPPSNIDDIEVPVSESYVDQYSKLYRHFPRFVESEL